MKPKWKAPNIRRRRYRQKYNFHFEGNLASRHWCFEFIRSEKIHHVDRKHPEKVKEYTPRITRFYRKIKERNQTRRRLAKIEHAEITMLSEYPSSVISPVGSIYEEFDMVLEDYLQGRTVPDDGESDFDLRMRHLLVQLLKPKHKGFRRLERLREVSDTIYEEHMVTQITSWPKREQYRAVYINSLRDRIVRMFFQLMKYGNEKTTLTKFQFYMCLLLHEFNIAQLVNFGYLFGTGGVNYTVGLSFIFSVLIQMPFNMCIMCMVSYSRSLILKIIADCMPLVKILRVPLFIAFLIVESRRLLQYEALVKTIYVTIFISPIWHNCSLPSANERCVPYFTTTPHNTNCSERVFGPNYDYYSTQFFVKYDIFELGTPGDLTDTDTMYWGVSGGKYIGSVIAFLLMALSANSISRLKTLIMSMQLIIIIIASVFVALITCNRITIEKFGWSYNNVNIGFLTNLIAVNLQISGLPVFMWISEMKPPNLNPATATVVHQVLKIIILLIISTTYTTLASFISIRYHMINQECFLLQGADIMFSMILDFFMLMHYARFWYSLWLICLSAMVAIYAIYVYQAATTSLIQVLPNGNLYRTFLMFVVMAVVVLMRLVNDLPYMYATLFGFSALGFTYINNFCFAVFVISIYFLHTPERMKYEYEVLCGNPPASFWIISWHFMVFLALLISLLSVFDLLTTSVTGRTLQMVIAGIYIASMFWLLLMDCTLTAVRAIQNKTLDTMLFPSIKWRAFEDEQFAKEMNMRRKMHQTIRQYCRHRCFQGSTGFQELAQKQRDKFDAIKKLADEGKLLFTAAIAKIDEDTLLFYNQVIVED